MSSLPFDLTNEPCGPGNRPTLVAWVLHGVAWVLVLGLVAVANGMRSPLGQMLQFLPLVALLDAVYLSIVWSAGAMLGRPSSGSVSLAWGLRWSSAVVVGLGLWMVASVVLADSTFARWSHPYRYGVSHWFQELVSALPAFGLIGTAIFLLWIGGRVQNRYTGGRWASPWPMRCVGCNYPLIQPTTDSCPECGGPVHAAPAAGVRPWPGNAVGRSVSHAEVWRYLAVALVKPRRVGGVLAESVPGVRWTATALGALLLLPPVFLGFGLWFHKLAIDRGWVDYFDRDTGRRFAWHVPGIDAGVWAGLFIGLLGLMLTILATQQLSRRLSERSGESPATCRPAAAAIAATAGVWLHVAVLVYLSGMFIFDILAVGESVGPISFMLWYLAGLIGVITGYARTIKGLHAALWDAARPGRPH